MRDYKRLIVGIASSLLIIIIGVFGWLWISNAKNANPLPIMASSDSQLAQGDDNTVTVTLSVQAVDNLQMPLEDIITRFEYLYPKVNVTTHYVLTSSILTLSDVAANVAINADAYNNTSNQGAPIADIDIILTENKLKPDDLTALKSNSNILSKPSSESKVANKDTVKVDNNKKDLSVDKDKEAWNITSFGYAIKGSQSADGVILTDNPAAITFRNFLLSSSGQDILKRYGYDDIDGYKDSVDEVFNATTRSKESDSDTPLKIKDALNNGQ